MFRVYYLYNFYQHLFLRINYYGLLKWYHFVVGKYLVDYLKDNNYNIISLSNESQHNYGANILELENGKILVQDKETQSKIEGSIFVPFHEIHKMYGGLHCSTNSFF